MSDDANVPDDPSPVPAERVVPTTSGATSAAMGGATGEPIRVVIQSSGGFARVLPWSLTAISFFVILLLLVIVLWQMFQYQSYFQKDPTIIEKFHSGDAGGADKVAIITVDGVIMSGEGYIKRQIDRVREDKAVKALVLRVNSPGGTVTGSHYIYHHLRRLITDKETTLGKGNFPMVVSMGSMAASGGYYISMAVGSQKNSIYAEPTTTTGSIGVVLPHYNIAVLMDKHGVKSDSIVSRPLKGMGSITREMKPEERAILQAYIDESFGRFKDVVRYGRPKFVGDDPAMDAVATGQIFTADQAKENGLIDQVGYIEEAVAAVATRAGLGSDTVRVVSYERPASLANLFSTAAQSQGPKIDAKSLIDMATPRAYYLYSWMPSLTAAAAQ